MRCLSVFVGGWTLEAAETVGSLIGVPDVLHTLAALVEQNLVVRDDGPTDIPHYRLLETIRQFALERLLTAGEEERAHHAHLQYLLQLARENDLERLDADVGTRMARLQADEANLRSGIASGIMHDPERALAALAGLDLFWYLADRRTAGRDLLARALKTDAGANRQERARVLQQAAWLASSVGDHAQAEPLADAARALAEQLGDRRTVARAQLCQGSVAMSRNDVVRAKALLEEALAQSEALADDWGLLMCLNELGIAAQHWGDAAAAVAAFERAGAIAIKRQLPARYHARYLDNLALAFRQLGRHEAAMEACLAALTLVRDAGGSSEAAVNRLTLARLQLDCGETAQAVSGSAEISESLVVLWETGNHWTLVEALEIAAAVMAAALQAAPAARTLGAAAALRDVLPRPIGVGERDTLSRQVAEVTAVLGEPAFTQAWTAGQSQPLDVTVAEGREVLLTLARD